MTRECAPDEYLKLFPDDGTPNSIRRAALKEATENRKFEIELYWKRATYFWAFIAAAFAAFFVLQKDPNDTSIAYIVACLGFLFSLAWHFVNRGSKFWQQNWEMHVDLLETEINGPIYKTVLQPNDYKFWNMTDAYPFSVSKINQILSFVVAIVWLTLILRTVAIASLNIDGSLLSFTLKEKVLSVAFAEHSGTILVMSAITVVSALTLVIKGRTHVSDLGSRIIWKRRTYSREQTTKAQNDS